MFLKDPVSLLAWGRAILADQPFSMLIGTRLTRLEIDAAELELPVADAVKQQFGFVHGGVISYLADNALGFACGARFKGQVLSSEFKINFTRPAIGETLVARAKLVDASRRQAVARCEVYAIKDGAEALCAAAQGTVVVTASDRKNDQEGGVSGPTI